MNESDRILVNPIYIYIYIIYNRIIYNFQYGNLKFKQNDHIQQKKRSHCVKKTCCITKIS